MNGLTDTTEDLAEENGNPSRLTAKAACTDGSSMRERVFARPKTRSLVMWSGGLDSTYALVRLLRETEDHVIGHHIHYLRGDPQAGVGEAQCEYQSSAVAALLPELKARYRQFEYTESRLDLSALSCSGNDKSMAMFIAAQVALSHGLTPFDRIVLGINSDIDRDWQPGTYAYEFRRLVSLRVLKAVWESEEVPYLYVWQPRPSREEELAYLPSAISTLTVSCQRPRQPDAAGPGGRFVTCGECYSCVFRSNLPPARQPTAAP